jgi:hypothetical protein
MGCSAINNKRFFRFKIFGLRPRPQGPELWVIESSRRLPTVGRKGVVKLSTTKWCGSIPSKRPAAIIFWRSPRTTGARKEPMTIPGLVPCRLGLCFFFDLLRRRAPRCPVGTETREYSNLRPSTLRTTGQFDGQIAVIRDAPLIEERSFRRHSTRLRARGSDDVSIRRECIR